MVTGVASGVFVGVILTVVVLVASLYAWYAIDTKSGESVSSKREKADPDTVPKIRFDPLMWYDITVEDGGLGVEVEQVRFLAGRVESGLGFPSGFLAFEFADGKKGYVDSFDILLAVESSAPNTEPGAVH